jgi:hypothetical protein
MHLLFHWGGPNVLNAKVKNKDLTPRLCTHVKVKDKDLPPGLHPQFCKYVFLQKIKISVFPLDRNNIGCPRRLLPGKWEVSLILL